MASAEIRRSPFSTDPHAIHKSIPILPSSTASSTLTPPRDPMDLTPSPPPSMGPPNLTSPVGDRNGNTNQQQQSQLQGGEAEGTPNGITNSNGNGNANASSNGNGNSTPAIGAAAAAQQPKVVQTAFIHKLYK